MVVVSAAKRRVPGAAITTGLAYNELMPGRARKRERSTASHILFPSSADWDTSENSRVFPTRVSAWISLSSWPHGIDGSAGTRSARSSCRVSPRSTLGSRRSPRKSAPRHRRAGEISPHNLLPGPAASSELNPRRRQDPLGALLVSVAQRLARPIGPVGRVPFFGPCFPVRSPAFPA